MALQKEIIFKNGVVIKYHYINKFEMNGKEKEVNLFIDSYTDATYRQLEKQDKINKDRYNELLRLIFEENEKTQKDVELIKNMSEEANSLVETFEDTNELNLKVMSTNIKLMNVNDFNMSNLYTLLKQQELFLGSEDV